LLAVALFFLTHKVSGKITGKKNKEGQEFSSSHILKLLTNLTTLLQTSLQYSWRISVGAAVQAVPWKHKCQLSVEQEGQGASVLVI